LIIANRNIQQPPVSQAHLVALSDEVLPDLAQETIGSYLASAQLLGRRTAELHSALASTASDPHFGPEPFSTLYQRSIYQTMRSHAARSFPSCADTSKNCRRRCALTPAGS
jgi:maltose alpha-D-glucosyltransferase/alpha-amylase